MTNSSAMLTEQDVNKYWNRLTPERKQIFEQNEKTRMDAVYQWLNLNEVNHTPQRPLHEPVYFDRLFRILSLDSEEKESVYSEVNRQKAGYRNYLYALVYDFNNSTKYHELSELSELPYLNYSLRIAIAEGKKDRIPIYLLDILRALTNKSETNTYSFFN